MTKSITDDQRAEAEDMGYNICESCGVSSIPAPGYANEGHQCGDDGLKDEYIDPAY